MLSLVRSVLTHATRGGRSGVSRRNFCSSHLGKETKGEMESKVWIPEKILVLAALSCVTATLGYNHNWDRKRARKEQESVGNSPSELPVADG